MAIYDADKILSVWLTFKMKITITQRQVIWKIKMSIDNMLTKSVKYMINEILKWYIIIYMYDISICTYVIIRYTSTSRVLSICVT